MSQQDFNVGLYPIVCPQVEEQEESLVFYAPPAIDIDQPVSQLISPVVYGLKACFYLAVFIAYVYINALGILYFFTE